MLRQFYVRRTLRIFPLYYLVLAIAFLFGDADVRSQLPWLATHTYNFWIAGQDGYPTHFSHFWSLCVEEQFYLLWPWIIVYSPRNRWIAIALAMIAVVPLYRVMATLLELNPIAFYTLTPSSLDALGLGALLAIVTGGAPVTARQERWLRRTALPIGLAAALALNAASSWTGIETAGELRVALVFVW